MESRNIRIRSAVRRPGSEQLILLSLVSFASTVIITRLFLELTGYPQLGNSELHIAHVLWGGLFLFIYLPMRLPFLLDECYLRPERGRKARIWLELVMGALLGFYPSFFA